MNRLGGKLRKGSLLSLCTAFLIENVEDVVALVEEAEQEEEPSPDAPSALNAEEGDEYEGRLSPLGPLPPCVKTCLFVCLRRRGMMNDATLRALFDSDGGPTRSLDLANTCVTDRGLLRIFRSSRHSVQHADFTGCTRISCVGLEAFLRSADALVSIRLGGGDAGRREKKPADARACDAEARKIIPVIAPRVLQRDDEVNEGCEGSDWGDEGLLMAAAPTLRFVVWPDIRPNVKRRIEDECPRIRVLCDYSACGELEDLRHSLRDGDLPSSCLNCRLELDADALDCFTANEIMRMTAQSNSTAPLTAETTTMGPAGWAGAQEYRCGRPVLVGLSPSSSMAHRKGRRKEEEGVRDPASANVMQLCSDRKWERKQAKNRRQMERRLSGASSERQAASAVSIHGRDDDFSLEIEGSLRRRAPAT